MTEIGAADGGIMSRLRAETMELHRETEQSPFQRSLMAGKLPLEHYADLLHELLQLHLAVESELRRVAEQETAIRLVLRPYQFQVSHLRSDLAFLGRSTEPPTMLPATERMISETKGIAARRPSALLGVHYVLEGSKNGGRFIAQALRRAYGLQTGGLAYLDPYGDLQTSRWQEFKTSMETANLPAQLQDEVVEAARLTFRGIIRIHGELSARATVLPETGAS